MVCALGKVIVYGGIKQEETNEKVFLLDLIESKWTQIALKVSSITLNLLIFSDLIFLIFSLRLNHPLDNLELCLTSSPVMQTQYALYSPTMVLSASVASCQASAPMK